MKQYHHAKTGETVTVEEEDASSVAKPDSDVKPVSRLPVDDGIRVRPVSRPPADDGIRVRPVSRPPVDDGIRVRPVRPKRAKVDVDDGVRDQPPRSKEKEKVPADDGIRVRPMRNTLPDDGIRVRPGPAVSADEIKTRLGFRCDGRCRLVGVATSVSDSSMTSMTSLGEGSRLALATLLVFSTAGRLDQPACEVKVGLGRRGERHLDLLVPEVAQHLKVPPLLLAVHRIGQALVAIAKNAIIHIYLATSECFRQVVFGYSEEQTLELAVECTKLVRSLTKDCAEAAGTRWRFEFSPECFSDTESEEPVGTRIATVRLSRPQQGEFGT